MEHTIAQNKRGIPISDFRLFREFCGVNDEKLKLIEKMLDVEIVVRNGSIIINGSDENALRTQNILSQFDELADSGVILGVDDIRFIGKYFLEHSEVSLKEMFSEDVRIQTLNKVVIPRGATQRGYLYSLAHSDVVIAIGPAGTGKTYLAVAMAISSLLKKKVSRIILTRPAVEAGENLGFLPGDLQDKKSPYIRPIYDALYEMLGPEKLQSMMEHGQIEVAPLAYMRGRTLSDSFVVLDEAQNCTTEQMKMLLTRLGAGSQVAVTGDVTQIDLPKGRMSGLVEAGNLLSEIEGIDIIHFSKRDVVRHELVEKIIGAYEENEADGHPKK